MELVINKIYI